MNYEVFEIKPDGPVTQQTEWTQVSQSARVWTEWDSLEDELGFTPEDKAAWLEANGRYYADPEQGWQDKLRMHAYPQRSASVYVMPSYQSPVTGKWIDTPSQRRDDLKRTGSRPWEGKEAETREAARQKQAADQKLDAALDHAVRSAWRDLPDSKKQAINQGL